MINYLKRIQYIVPKSINSSNKISNFEHKKLEIPSIFSENTQKKSQTNNFSLARSANSNITANINSTQVVDNSNSNFNTYKNRIQSAIMPTIATKTNEYSSIFAKNDNKITNLKNTHSNYIPSEISPINYKQSNFLNSNSEISVFSNKSSNNFNFNEYKSSFSSNSVQNSVDFSSFYNYISEQLKKEMRN